MKVLKCWNTDKSNQLVDWPEYGWQTIEEYVKDISQKTMMMRKGLQRQKV